MKKAPKKITTLVEAKKEITRLRTQVTNTVKSYEKLISDIEADWCKSREDDFQQFAKVKKQNQILDLKCQEYELQLAAKWWQFWK
ncbi:hypothetical protein UFOVP153_21 [uncultured Caudovirales phage]|uniref:Uncharacterized protein n=1 Tax=uncultured Caudovirales phage TaxID=2100421 RepID=A0A6J7W9L5_9CAUD|nr:hypothetical protein UFOVP69_37 [uncultured Caudovirales phage]CAB5170454.1 hypothetical protein UFOVP153_21 [uncultured Caudovirales phage]